jgi:hypothetical protein
MQTDTFIPPLQLQDLPTTPRLKRVRSHNQDLDVELDSYFRTKRFMTEAVTKEMEEVAISEPPLTTSPSRTSTLARLAEKGPSRSNIVGVLDFDAPRLSVSASSGRRRQLVVTNANSPQLNRSGSFSDMSMTGSSLAPMNDEFDEEEEEERGNDPWLDWRSPMSPKPQIPRPVPLEDALQRLIEKKKETGAKALVLHRTPSEIIKGAAQSAIYARLRASPPNGGASRFPTSPLGSQSGNTYPQAPFTNFTQRGSWGSFNPDLATSSASSSPLDTQNVAYVPNGFGQRSNNTFPRAPTPPLLIDPRPSKRRSLLIEELPEDDDTTMVSSPTLKSSNYFAGRRAAFQPRYMHSEPQQHEDSTQEVLTTSTEQEPVDEMTANEGMASNTFPVLNVGQQRFCPSYSDYMLTDDSMAFQPVVHSMGHPQHTPSGFGNRHFQTNNGFGSSLHSSPFDDAGETPSTPFGSSEGPVIGSTGFQTSPPPTFSLFHSQHSLDNQSQMELSTPPQTPPVGPY